MKKPVSNPIRIVKPRRQWTDGDREDILARYDYGQGQSFKEIAKIYDVSDTAIRRWLTEWGAFVPREYGVDKPYKTEPKEEPTNKEEPPLTKAVRLLGKRVRVDKYEEGDVYSLDGKRINPYFLIPAAGLCKGRAWV